jgi:hypothetical protein
MNTRHRLHLLFFFFAVLLLVSSVASAAEKRVDPGKTKQASSAVAAEARDWALRKAEADKAKGKYLRLLRDKQDRPTAMEIAIVRFQPADKKKSDTVVDLIGAVHVAEPAFFDTLNEKFTDYDAVLYELVAPEGTRPVKGQKRSGGNPLSALQTGLTRLLNLEFQLDGIDYQAKNLVHADMSPEEFAKSMRERGESVFAIFLRMVIHGMAEQSQDSGTMSDVQLLMALLNKDRSLTLKRMMAKQFENMGGAILAIDGPKGSTLITQRNKKALSVLRRELKAGKKRLAIFYGAGHMPDMARRLEKDFGMKPTSTRWITAWDMSDPKSKAKTPHARRRQAVATP